MKTAKQSNHRYYYSHMRLLNGDGMGHCMGITSFDMGMALRFNLTYTHRVGDWGSLTRSDPQAVEDFFGWGHNEVPRTVIQREGCQPRNKTWPDGDDKLSCYPCGAAAPEKKMKIRHVVEIPSRLGYQCQLRDTCQNETADFLARHNQSHTVFQLPFTGCGPQITSSRMVDTRNIFYYKYWERHGTLPWKSRVGRRAKRTIGLQAEEVSIAVHVRRGDFFHPAAGRKGHIIHDGVFASVIQTCLHVIQEVGGPFGSLPVAVHIYSEGKSRPGANYLHDVSEHDNTYYDGYGRARGVGWWEEQIFSKGGRADMRKAIRGFRTRLRTELHISEDTLRSAHEMISADVFVGSLSAMSTTLVWALSRGVVLVPTHGAVGRAHEGRACCSVPFDRRDGRLSDAMLRRFWTAYSRANTDTVIKHFFNSSAINLRR